MNNLYGNIVATKLSLFIIYTYLSLMPNGIDFLICQNVSSSNALYNYTPM